MAKPTSAGVPVARRGRRGSGDASSRGSRDPAVRALLDVDAERLEQVGRGVRDLGDRRLEGVGVAGRRGPIAADLADELAGGRLQLTGGCGRFGPPQGLDASAHGHTVRRILDSMEPFRTIIEPFRIHAVEPIRMTTRDERVDAIEIAGRNLFALHADDVLIDLLTDSGTGAMSRDQWAAIQHGDESYAGSPSWFAFLEAVQELWPFCHVIPTHQGRAAEKILFSVLGGPGKVIPNNTHFDTTRANVEATGAEALDLVIAEGRDPSAIHPFKGNVDIPALEALLAERAADVPVVFVTITNNSGGGQPVSLENLRAVRAVCDRHGKPLFLDACRFAENAWFIKTREQGQADRSIPDIVRDMAALADGMTMSAKKDGLANIGGWLAMNDDSLADACRNLLILTEGFPTYGGLAGRDLEAIAQGLREVVDEDYLEYRIRSTAYLGEALHAAGVPLVQPFGGHAIYLDARGMLPQIPALQYPGQALAIALYVEGGIRGCEIGTVMFGRHPDGSEAPAEMDLVRLAIPRRTYTQSHIDYVIELVQRVADHSGELR
jgi:tryptophanase